MIIATPTPGIETPVDLKSKGGRPRKYVSNAEKQKAWNQRQRQKQEDAERRSLIAQLLKLYRRHQDKIGGNLPSDRRRAELKEGERIHQRAYLGSLQNMTIEQLQMVLATEDSNKDFSGKGSEDTSKNIAITASRNNVVADINGRTVVTYGTGKVTESSPSVLSRGWGSNYVERLLEDTVDELVRPMYDGNCPLCDRVFPHAETFNGRANAELFEHLMLMFRVGEKQLENHNKKSRAFAESNAALPENMWVRITALDTTEAGHYRRLWQEMEKLEKQRRRRKKVS